MASSVENEASFSLTCVTVDDISKEVKRHDIKKATQESDIPTKVIKQFPNLFIDFLHKNINSCLTEGTFPNDFKKAVVHPIHKKECKTEKSNYRPISILPNLSKIYEILLYDQMYSYFDTFFVKYQCGFRKGYNAQHCLLVMIEKMKEARDKNKVCAAVLTILVKCLIVLHMISLLRNYMLLVLTTNLLESYTHILIIGCKSQKLVLNTVKFLTLFLVFLKAQY